MKGFARVSVVIPCYNAEDKIGRAVESVYNQTLRPEEVVLVDDCSSDNTLNVLSELQRRYPIGWVKVIHLKENLGAGSARNRGWEVAQQDYIAFLDSDDSWHPSKIENQYQWMLKHPAADLTGHGCKQLDSEEYLHKDMELVASAIDFKRVGKWAILLSNRFPTRSVMLKRSLPFRFQEGKRYSEDYHLWLQISLSGYQCFSSSEELAYLYKAPYGAEGLSGRLWEMEKGELASYRALFVEKNRLVVFPWLSGLVFSEVYKASLL